MHNKYITNAYNKYITNAHGMHNKYTTNAYGMHTTAAAAGNFKKARPSKEADALGPRVLR